MLYLEPRDLTELGICYYLNSKNSLRNVVLQLYKVIVFLSKNLHIIRNIFLHTCFVTFTIPLMVELFLFIIAINIYVIFHVSM